MAPKSDSDEGTDDWKFRVHELPFGFERSTWVFFLRMRFMTPTSLKVEFNRSQAMVLHWWD
ncbi:hypothetical protein R6Q59_035880 [Mikania micrantha]